MTIVFVLLIVAACSVFYLSLPQQKLLYRSLDNKLAQLVATLLLIAALIAGILSFSVGTSIFALLVIAMLILSLLPFLALCKKGQDHDH